jgi:FAD:protein FMN transferase
VITRRALFSLDFDRPPRAAGALLRVHRTAMACRVEVALSEEDGRDVAAARAALDEADRVERLLTVFRESSELSRINREASEGADAVEAEVYALLRRCRQLHAATDGAFDITSTPLSRCWGFLKRQGQVPPNADIETARALVGMRRVDFDDEARSIRFARAGMQLNLNAVGKGYALDRMARVLRKDGVRHALLSAGGSSVVAVGGRRGGWPIDIRSALVSRSHIARLRLHGGALGTSGPGEQFVIAEGTRYGHVIDPRTGRPARGVLSASVVAADGATADALSTAFFVGGCELAASYCAAHPGTLALLTLDDEDQTTRRFGHYAGCDVTEPRT